MLTDADDTIRSLDIPERYQLASSGIPPLAPLENGPAPYINPSNLIDAADWMTSRISARCTEMFLIKDEKGDRAPLYLQFITAVTDAIRFLAVDFLEPPFVFTYRNDFLTHHYLLHEPGSDKPRSAWIDLLTLPELWSISHHLPKFRSLLHRKQLLEETFYSLNVEKDAYFDEVFQAAENVEEVADVKSWVEMRYGARLEEIKEGLRVEGEGEGRVKRATRVSAYDQAKKSVVSLLAEVRFFSFLPIRGGN